MHQVAIRAQLSTYLANNPKMANADVLRDFLSSDTDVFARGQSTAHVTASGFILDSRLEKVLLIEHAKYKKFCPPGGHVDPGESAYAACLREVGEEVGLKNLKLIYLAIYDVDVHRIPASIAKGEPEHWHIDVRYALMADDNEDIDLNEVECLSVKWVLVSVLASGDDPSLTRLAKKAKSLKGLIPV